jgi:hypothetical protein
VQAESERDILSVPRPEGKAGGRRGQDENDLNRKDAEARRKARTTKSPAHDKKSHSDRAFQSVTINLQDD